MRSLGVSAGVYQSVMMTPPNGSAETSGMKLMVSSEARHRIGVHRDAGAVIVRLVAVRLGAEQAARAEQGALFLVPAAEALLWPSRLLRIARWAGASP